MNETFFPEKPELKYGFFALNALLVVGLALVPTPDISFFPSTPHWLEKANDILSILLAIPLVYQIPHLFRKTGLKISEDGIWENLSTFRDNQFGWHEMIRIRFARVLFMKYLLIDIREPQKYIQRQNILHKWPMRGDMKNFGTPMKIPIYTLDKKPEEILFAIYELHQKMLGQIQAQMAAETSKEGAPQ
jgi:hypothetical protein